MSESAADDESEALKIWSRNADFWDKFLGDGNEFQQQLIAAVAEAERDDPEHPTRGYYESWLVSLERLIAKKQLLEH